MFTQNINGANFVKKNSRHKKTSPNLNHIRKVSPYIEPKLFEGQTATVKES